MPSCKNCDAVVKRLKTEIVALKAKLKETKSLKKPLTISKADHAKKIAEVLKQYFGKGYQAALNEIEKIDAAYDQHMSKASKAFEKNVLPKLKKSFGSKTKDSSKK